MLNKFKVEYAPKRQLHQQRHCKYLAGFAPLKPAEFVLIKIQQLAGQIAGISKVNALKRTTKMVEHREGSDPDSTRKSPE